MSEQPPADPTASPVDPADPTASHAATVPPAAPAHGAEPSLVTVVASLRTIKMWLVVLTVVLAAVVGALVVVAATAFDDAREPEYAADIYEPSDQQVADARAEIEGAFGDRLEAVEVRILQPEEDMGEFGPPASLYVEYRLKGFDTVIAAVVMDPYSSISASGLVPTRGSMTSRMTDAQFEGLLAAYAESSRSPVGGVRRYGDSPMMMPAQNVADEITSQGRTYPTDELWAVMEGMLVEGDELDVDQLAYGGQTLHVFHEDPETGEFTYLGTEPAMWW